MAADAHGRLPHWDMTTVYPGLDSPEFEHAFRSVVGDVERLTVLFDRSGVSKREALEIDEATVRSFETVVGEVNRVLDEMRTVSQYIRAIVGTDARDALAQAKLSALQPSSVRLGVLLTRLTAWIGSLDIEQLLARSPVARAHTYALHRALVEAEHQMPPGEEELAAELHPTGSHAWNKLHSDLTSLITVNLEVEGQVRELPMTAVRNLAYDEDRDVRRRAYEAEIDAWREHALPLAAALNSIKGANNLLTRRRRWEAPLDAALFASAIDRATLDAMLSAAQDAFPDLRRYLKAKARLLSLPALTWYDLFAPVAGGRARPFREAEAFIVEQFGTFSPRMRSLAERAFRERWIDAEPRVGKRGGAWCMSIRSDESRVLTNYTPSFSAVSTLAHELGHAYHNLCLAERTMLQRHTPMTLAETASIFCETLVTQAALEKAGDEDQRVILEESLQGACQVVVDITSRFLFESSVCERREERELSADELCELMLDAQRATYGDGLDTSVLHPFMWAAKPHYYGMSFYNYPYMFGLLFGLGLFARYREDPRAFVSGYDDLLASTGMYDAATLAGRFGIDLRSPDFWRSSLDVIRADIVRFEELINRD